MLHTLRQQDGSDSDDDSELHPYAKHQKRRLVRKHPNKHHEGDRKRWRDAVTERERKRYEGVWAANKGIHYSILLDEERNHTLSSDNDLSQLQPGRLALSSVASTTTLATTLSRTTHASQAVRPRRSTSANEQVSNIVTREVWSRSRLPDAVLEAIWDLVDTDGVGRLNKDEFVVGMWLIDQRLKGRKLPVKVSDSVWTSVRGIEGIKIRGMK